MATTQTQAPPQGSIAAPPPPDLSGEQSQRSTAEVLAAAANAAKGKKEQFEGDELVDATDWFLSDTDETDLTHTFQINVGSIKQKRWIDWTVKPVDMDRLRKIRRQAQQGNRMQRRAGNSEFDEVTANVQIVLDGTISPDLRQAAQQIGVADPGIAVRSRFAHKPGLLAQIAGEIMSISGYDDEDVREVDAARG